MSILVTYFSATGGTERAAKEVAGLCQAELFEIRPEVPYSSKDLDWMDSSSRSTRESKDAKAEVAIAQLPDLAGVTTLFVGFPVWWYAAPHIVDSFLEKLDIKGLEIVPFCTSGGTGISGCEKKLKARFPQAKWLPGLRITGSNQSAVSSWIHALNLD